MTGLTGQDGGYLAEQLVAAGYDVHGVVNDDLGGALALPHLRAVGDRLTLQRADLRDVAAVCAVVDAVKPELFMNLGGCPASVAS